MLGVGEDAAYVVQGGCEFVGVAAQCEAVDIRICWGLMVAAAITVAVELGVWMRSWSLSVVLRERYFSRSLASCRNAPPTRSASSDVETSLSSTRFGILSRAVDMLDERSATCSGLTESTDRTSDGDECSSAANLDWQTAHYRRASIPARYLACGGAFHPRWEGSRTPPCEHCHLRMSSRQQLGRADAASTAFTPRSMSTTLVSWMSS